MLARFFAASGRRPRCCSRRRSASPAASSRSPPPPTLYTTTSSSTAPSTPNPPNLPPPTPTTSHPPRSNRRLRSTAPNAATSASSAAASNAKPPSSEFVELKPEVVDFPRLHAREEALYFHDAFALPWEKDKHYRVLYRLEKKYFPHQSLDNAFVSADASPPSDADKGLVLFDGEKKDGDEGEVKKKDDDKGEVLERKVEDFFRSLKKGPAGEADAKTKKKTGLGGEPRQVKRDLEREEEWPQPYLVSRRTELRPRWDGPTGTVVLVDKPKGWTSFTVCGKLRRLVKVQKIPRNG